MSIETDLDLQYQKIKPYEIKIVEKRILLTCNICGPFEFIKADERGKELALGCEITHIVNFPTHRVYRKDFEVEV